MACIGRTRTYTLQRPQVRTYTCSLSQAQLKHKNTHYRVNRLENTNKASSRNSLKMNTNN